MPNKLFIIDGHALIFKTYYAFLKRPMVNSKGMDTSILFGFTKYIFDIIEREKPTHFAVVFDPPGGTFRNEMYKEYKANRQETPQLIIEAREPLTKICEAMGIPAMTIMGYEADDVIGTLAKRFGNEDTQVYMVTPDKDYGQLVDENIFQYKPGRSGGDDEIYGIKEICEKYGINNTDQVIELLTLCGDTADNVPGVDSVGEKTASKLLLKYGTVENIYAHLDELTAKQQTKFKEAESHIDLSHELVTIKVDVPVDIELEKMKLKELNNPEVFDLFDYYEFNSLKKYIKNADKLEAETYIDFDVTKISATELIKKAEKVKRVAIYIEENEIFSKINHITLALGEKDKYYSCKDKVEVFKSILENEEIEKAGYDLKKQVNILKFNNIELKGKLYDIDLLHYLINPEQSSKIDILAKNYFNIKIETLYEDNEGNLSTKEPEVNLFTNEQVLKDVISYDKDTAVIFMLSQELEKQNKENGVDKLYWEMEEPLLRVLAKMERNGVKVDLNQLHSFSDELNKELIEREARIREMCDEPELNISSPKQVGIVLFEKMKLDPNAKKSAKGNWSTDEATLNGISHLHPIANEILEFRAVKKLLSTYLEPFDNYISPITGRIHTTFNQALTSTGRLSSSNPNLQNIPIRTERGKEIRRAFVAGTENGLILSADYSQIELRIMAHLSGDAHLIQAFKDGIDVHAATAAKIFKIPYEDVTPDQRRIAKTANFGIMYGISAFGLSQRLDIPVGQAKRIIDDYFEAFPAIKFFIKDTVDFATTNGYVETIFGRRRYIPELQSKNKTVKSLGERNAVNAPIQGTSADIIKLAMIGVDKRMVEKNLKSKMVLQIHDELLFDTINKEVEILKQIVVEEMENVINLLVPLTVECNYGKNWLEAH